MKRHHGGFYYFIHLAYMGFPIDPTLISDSDYGSKFRSHSKPISVCCCDKKKSCRHADALLNTGGNYPFNSICQLNIVMHEGSNLSELS